MLAKRYTAAKYAIWLLLAVLFFVLQVTPGLFEINGTRPMLLIGLAVSVALFEGELAGGLYAVVCGFLCDLYGYDAVGFYALLLFCCCALVGILSRTYITASVINCFIASFAVMLIIQLTSCFFQLVLWGYSGAGTYILHHVLPLTLYTGVVSVPIYYIVRAIFNAFKKKLDE